MEKSVNESAEPYDVHHAPYALEFLEKLIPVMSATFATAGFNERKDSSFFFNGRFYRKFYTTTIGLSLAAAAKLPAIFKALVHTATEKFKQIKTLPPLDQYPALVCDGELADRIHQEAKGTHALFKRISTLSPAPKERYKKGVFV